MKKFLIILAVTGSILFLLPFQRSAHAVNLGPFKVTESFCQHFTKLGALLNAFQIVNFPVAGFPGIAMGMTQRTSVLHDVCDFITQLSQLEGVNAIFFSANYLNELTGKKWDHHLKMADKTWNLANTFYDFDNGQMRPGAMTSESNARDMNDWMEDSYSWYHKSFNNKEVYIKHRAERESDMQTFAQASYQKAILQDAVNCPAPPENKNYKAIYEKQVKPMELKREDAKDDLEFFRQQLYKMGPRFMNNDKELAQYLDGLERMTRDGVTYKMTPKNVTQTTHKPSKKTDKNGHVVQEKKKVQRTSYRYEAITDTRVFNDFKSKWVKQWGTWVTAQWSSKGSFGALNSASTDSVEDDFKDLGHECNPNRLGRGLDRDKPDYNRQLQRLVDECNASIRSNQKKAENLLDYYITQYQQSLYMFKSANSFIWTIESEHAGINRLISTKGAQDQDGSTFQQEQVSCSDKLQPAEMELLQLKQNNVNNQLTEQIAKESMKQSMMMETEKIEESNQRQEEQRKRIMIEQKNKDLQKAADNVGEPFSIRSGNL